MRRVLLGMLALTLVAAVGGLRSGRAVVAQDATPEPQTRMVVTLQAEDFKFSGPSEVGAGLVTLTLVNNGEEPHHAQLVKLNEGVTMDDFEAALQNPDPSALFAAVTFTGGPPTTPPGEEHTVVVRLDPGDYVVLCFIAGDDGVPHLAKGMVFPFTVTGEDSGAPDPTADAEATLLDYEIEMPDTLPAGESTLQVTNQGDEPHQLAILKLAPGMSADTLIAIMMASEEATEGTPEATPDGGEMDHASPVASPEGEGMELPPFSEAGGIQVLSPGLTGWAVLDLEPGDYVAVCFVPNAEGVPHAALGMVKAFTVE